MYLYHIFYNTFSGTGRREKSSLRIEKALLAVIPTFRDVSENKNEIWYILPSPFYFCYFFLHLPF
jgi:hypothetical protein